MLSLMSLCARCSVIVVIRFVASKPFTALLSCPLMSGLRLVIKSFFALVLVMPKSSPLSAMSSARLFSSPSASSMYS